MNSIIAPSMLSCDFSNLGKESLRMLECGGDWLHLDIMDGHFVDNITIGSPVVKAIRKSVGKKAFLDCHLMVSDPVKWVNDFADAGADMFNFHVEAVEDLEGLIDMIHEKGMKAGIAVNAWKSDEFHRPPTPIDRVLPLCGKLDMVLIMTVNPGFGGQAFMKTVLPKVTKIRELFPKLDIQVDGGVGPDTIDFAVKAGANVIVAGSSIFKAPDVTERIALLRRTVDNELKT